MSGGGSSSCAGWPGCRSCPGRSRPAASDRRAGSLGAMPNVGPLELVVVLVIALIVLGPKRLPEVGRSLGRGIREFKDSVSGNDKDDEPTNPPAASIDPPAT